MTTLNMLEANLVANHVDYRRTTRERVSERRTSIWRVPLIW